MSDAKFASITSALLARKGEAAPSVIIPAEAYQPPVAPPRPAQPPRVAKAPAVAKPLPKPVRVDHEAVEHPDRRRRVVITLTGDEYIRLGIIAAKKDSSRHDLVRDALFDQLDAFAREQGNCHCILTGEPCDCVTVVDQSDIDAEVEMENA